MKKIILIFIPLLFLGFLAVKVIPPEKTDIDKNTKQDTYRKSENTKKQKVDRNNSVRIKQSVNCKTCHETEYPTHYDPGLLECPRTDMVTVYHPPDEGPETVLIDEMSSLYNGVNFPHKIHAEMSEMSGGCTGCHHYNTTGPVLNCRKCHSVKRSRDDISLPDLKAAYHRQCVSCHRQWNNDRGCNKVCHQSIESTSKKISDEEKGLSHPEINIPDKLVWQTNSKTNKTVTFYHNEHTELFKLECKSCHTSEGCISCHLEKSIREKLNTALTERSIEEHHKPCSNCHMGNSCNKCHKDHVMQPFDHGTSSGWVLKSYHKNVNCSNCHGSSLPYKRTGHKCVTCHKNFTAKFDHKLAGFEFSEGHTGLECKNCHAGDDFIKTPVCTECHDDKSYPQDLPGKRK